MKVEGKGRKFYNPGQSVPAPQHRQRSTPNPSFWQPKLATMHCPPAARPVSFFKRVPMTSCGPTFKLTLPSEFVQAHMAHLIESDLSLVDQAEERAWPIALMPRKNKDKYEYTLQGWKAFVNDQGIQPGDRLEFELVEPGRLKATVVKRTPYLPTAPLASDEPPATHHDADLANSGQAGDHSRNSSHSDSMEHTGALDKGSACIRAPQGGQLAGGSEGPVSQATTWGQAAHILTAHSPTRQPAERHAPGSTRLPAGRPPDASDFRPDAPPAQQPQPHNGWGHSTGQKRSWTASESSSEGEGSAERDAYDFKKRQQQQEPGEQPRNSKAGSPNRRPRGCAHAGGMSLLSSAALVDNDREKLRRALTLANERADQAELQVEACQAVLRHTGQVIDGQTSRGLIVASALMNLGNRLGSDEMLGQGQGTLM
ncbi:hypothetical protein WJX72_006577 [[Myrmecia] bisecta]|uniref:TF-B3 domain-containing protein n=1 Tax=[Myrmecia] bisecta TaxID=41462 RepID=A0AAW1PFI4_9CHLO